MLILPRLPRVARTASVLRPAFIVARFAFRVTYPWPSIGSVFACAYAAFSASLTAARGAPSLNRCRNSSPGVLNGPAASPNRCTISVYRLAADLLPA